MLSITYVGSDPDRDLAGLTALGPPLAGSLEDRQTHLESQHANDAGLAWGHRVYTKSGFLGSIPDALVDAHGRARRRRSRRRRVLDLGAGRCARAHPGRCDRVHRAATAPYWIGAETQWDDPDLDGAHIAWSRRASR